MSHTIENQNYCDNVHCRIFMFIVSLMQKIIAGTYISIMYLITRSIATENYLKEAVKSKKK